MSETTGKIDFTYGGETFQTWYKVVGDLKSGVRPLVAIHGGPGVSHHYMLTHTALTTSRDIPVILYDQLGIGESSHLADKPAAFWTVDLFIDELENLLAHFGIQDNFDLVGHSWGGMMGAHFAAHRRPSGLKHLVLASTTPSMALWEKSTNKLLGEMPEGFKEMIKKHEKEGTTGSPEYQEAMQAFYQKHVCTLKEWPATLLQSFEAQGKDPTVYSIMLGPSEFTITGTLKTWSILDKIQDISTPTLLVNGAHDEAHDIGVAPFFAKLPRVKWLQLARSSHTYFYEEPERYFRILGDFLSDA